MHQRGIKLVLTGFLLAFAFGAGGTFARSTIPDADLGVVALRELPLQAQETHRLVLQGGPFPFDKDGVVFGNRERILPVQKRGYYREYTVRTPGSHDRGARRMVCGGAATTPQACYYSADHYASFRKIVP